MKTTLDEKNKTVTLIAETEDEFTKLWCWYAEYQITHAETSNWIDRIKLDNELPKL